MQSFHNRALTVPRIKSGLSCHTGKFLSGERTIINKTDCVVTQMLDLADKDVKAIATMLKDVKENMLLMNKKRVYVKETGNYKKKKRTKWKY